MSEKNLMIFPIEKIQKVIFIIRNKRVMLDADLAEMYGVSTKAFNQAIKRNRARFPSDFIFQLSWVETNTLRSQTVTLKRGKNIKYRPYAFTEHGAIMAANVLNNKRAVEASVYVVRAFIRLREVLATHKNLAHKIAELECKTDRHNEEIQTLFATIYELMEASVEKSKGKIGFITNKNR